MARSEGTASGGASGAARSERSELYKLAYLESVRAVEFQGRQLEGVRQRTVQYLAFIGTATAFLVGTGLSGPTRDGWFFAIAGFGTLLAAACLVMAVRILLLLSGYRFGLPRLEWAFGMSGKRLVEWIEPEVGAPNETDYVRALTLLNDEAYETNAVALAALSRTQTWFVLCGFAQLLVWVILAWAKG